MPAVIATGLDYSARRLSGASIRAAGHSFVNRYLWFPGQGFPSLTAEEFADLSANGVEVHAIYEQNTNDPAGGWNSGVRMGTQAVASSKDAGLPQGHTIYMCADAWLATNGIPVATAMSFLDGARSVINPAGYLTGAYGFRDFIYAAQDGGHADRFWLCGAESGVRDGIHQYQRNYRTNPNGPDLVAGVAVDINSQYLPMLEDDMGQLTGRQGEMLEQLYEAFAKPYVQNGVDVGDVLARLGRMFPEADPAAMEKWGTLNPGTLTNAMISSYSLLFKQVFPALGTLATQLEALAKAYAEGRQQDASELLGAMRQALGELLSANVDVDVTLTPAVPTAPALTGTIQASS